MESQELNDFQFKPGDLVVLRDTCCSVYIGVNKACFWNGDVGLVIKNYKEKHFLAKICADYDYLINVYDVLVNGKIMKVGAGIITKLTAEKINELVQALF